MNKFILATIATLFAANVSFAQAPAATATPAETATAPAEADCEAKAVGKRGKPLTGAAKASFMKKCKAGK